MSHDLYGPGTSSGPRGYKLFSKLVCSGSIRLLESESEIDTMFYNLDPRLFKFQVLNMYFLDVNIQFSTSDFGISPQCIQVKCEIK